MWYNTDMTIFRKLQNIGGVEYTPTRRTVLFAEDYNSHSDAITELEKLPFTKANFSGLNDKMYFTYRMRETDLLNKVYSYVETYTVTMDKTNIRTNTIINQQLKRLLTEVQKFYKENTRSTNNFRIMLRYSKLENNALTHNHGLEIPLIAGGIYINNTQQIAPENITSKEWGTNDWRGLNIPFEKLINFDLRNGTIETVEFRYKLKSGTNNMSGTYKLEIDVEI